MCWYAPFMWQCTKFATASPHLGMQQGFSWWTAEACLSTVVKLEMQDSRLGIAFWTVMSVRLICCERIAGGDAANQYIDSIEADVSLPNLQVLLLGENKLTSIDSLGLSKLTSLRSLFLQNNMITCLEGLSCLTALEELVCSTRILF
jgi:hypothetical protein